MASSGFAAAVSRCLGREFTRAEWLRSGRVRGWGHWTSGFQVETCGDRAALHYVTGDWAPPDADEREKLARLRLDGYVAHLMQHGYTLWSCVDLDKPGRHNPNRVEVAK